MSEQSPEPHQSYRLDEPPALPEPNAVPGAPAGPEEPAPVAAQPQPLGVIVAATGNAEVDAAVERLGDADALPTQAHIEVYEDVHHGLRDALAALDENRG
jgi:hypothetical protein